MIIGDTCLFNMDFEIGLWWCTVALYLRVLFCHVHLSQITDNYLYHINIILFTGVLLLIIIML